MDLFGSWGVACALHAPPCQQALPAVKSVKRGKAFVIQMFNKVDLAEGDPSTRDNFSPYKRVMICINVSIFFTYDLY